jgi:ATP-dependent DNA helicase RecQ
MTPLSVLQQYWHYDSFRDLQEEIIFEVLQENDVLAILPTGGGKSLCYQLPTILLDGACLVISPLIALMQDQHRDLNEKGIASLYVHSGLNQKEVEAAFAEMTTGDYKFIFLSPERLQTQLLKDYLPNWNIRLIAVDEAHCISQWGYDFRPPYLRIAEIKKILLDVPIIALTASATPKVQDDIIEKLEISTAKKFIGSFQRKNISISCLSESYKLKKICDILQKVKGSALVYCRSRLRTKEVSDALCAIGLQANFYHAGLSSVERELKQNAWINNETRIMSCTNAFGMGIHKSDVRCVIHYDLPESPEAYYQEIGRAGRDNHKSYAIVLYSEQDLHKMMSDSVLKFPSIQKIQEVYQAVCNYVGAGIGNTELEVFDFNMSDFCRAFKLNTLEAYAGIQVLAQQGFWQLNDGFQQSAQIQILADKFTLQEIEKMYPEMDEVIKQCLRLYNSLFHHPTKINEFQIAQKLSVAVDYVSDILSKMHNLKLIEYIRPNQTPKLTFLHDRVIASHLSIDMQLQERLRRQHEERIAFMKNFAEENKSCRLNTLVNYFGEQTKEDCGICDNCLRKNITSSKKTFEEIKQTILESVEINSTTTIHHIMAKFSSIKQGEARRIIRFMLDDGILHLTDADTLMINKKIE